MTKAEWSELQSSTAEQIISLTQQLRCLLRNFFMVMTRFRSLDMSGDIVLQPQAVPVLFVTEVLNNFSKN